MTFIKLNPYIFEDKYDLLDKMEKLCCDRDDCHTHTLSYHSSNPNILILSLFHKGSWMFNIKYNLEETIITSRCK